MIWLQALIDGLRGACAGLAAVGREIFNPDLEPFGLSLDAVDPGDADEDWRHDEQFLALVPWWM
jgi:hypothetical protein